MTFRQFAVFLLWAAVLFSAGPAPAQSSLPRPFAPWMAFEDNLREQQPVPPLEEAEKPRAKTEGAAASRGTERPAAAPEDTVELTGRIYGKTDEPSALELGYSRRAGEDLVQFGYDMFGREEKEKEPEKEDENLPAGAVQESFLLNIGDRLNVTFRGQRQDGKTYTITGEGQVIIDELPPYPPPAAASAICARPSNPKHENCTTPKFLSRSNRCVRSASSSSAMSGAPAARP